MNKKIIILKNSEDHFWYSLNIIEASIVEAIHSSTIAIEIFDIQAKLNDSQIEKLKLLSRDHSLYFYYLSDSLSIVGLTEELKKLGRFTYLIPIYGNMTIETERWTKLNNILKGEKVLLLCASERSVKQVSALVQNKEAVKLLPYPFEMDSKTLKKDNITRFIYAGRITTGKNILDLMEVFSKALYFREDIELHIAGQFHDRGQHFHGYQVPIEKLKERFFLYFTGLQSKIIYHGNLSQDDLFQLYGKMDVFCSASTYHDEDFGVSAAQAGLSGLHLLLSDWGGHADFPQAELVKVEVDDLCIPQISKESLLKKILKLKKTSQQFDHTELRNYLSFKSFNERLENIINKEGILFEGLSSTYLDFCEASKKSAPFFENTPKTRSLYHRIYDSYLGCD